MSKSQVKKLLSGMSKEDVINVVLELYDARKEAREYLDYFVNPDETGELEKFKKIVLKEFDDNGTRMPQCRFSVCRKSAVSACAEKPCLTSRNWLHQPTR